MSVWVCGSVDAEMCLLWFAGISLDICIIEYDNQTIHTQKKTIKKRKNTTKVHACKYTKRQKEKKWKTVIQSKLSLFASLSLFVDFRPSWLLLLSTPISLMGTSQLLFPSYISASNTISAFLLHSLSSFAITMLPSAALSLSSWHLSSSYHSSFSHPFLPLFFSLVCPLLHILSDVFTPPHWHT